MTVIISFRKAEDWHVANWVYRQFSSDVIAQSPEDEGLKYIMQQSEALGLLAVDDLEQHMSVKVLKEIRKVIEATLLHKLHGWKQAQPDDTDGQKMYLESLSKLLELIKIEMEFLSRLTGSSESKGSE